MQDQRRDSIPLSEVFHKKPSLSNRRGIGKTEPQIVVAVARGIVVPIGNAAILRGVVPRPAAVDAVRAGKASDP